jgi:hypothetical protein
MQEPGCLPSVCMQSEREVVLKINIQETILRIVQRSPKLSTWRTVSLVGAVYAGVANST